MSNNFKIGDVVQLLGHTAALKGGNGEPVTLKLTPDGYYTARELLRSESGPVVS